MKEAGDTHETVALLLQTVAFDTPGTDGLEPKKTRHPRLGSAGHARTMLTALQHAAPAQSGLTSGHVLGIGGMGEVRAATQTSLGRTVAVKRVRPAVRSSELAVRLLQEGWVTGALEHPNIVPVHDLSVDADGEPYLVLKRVHGDCWLDLIHDPDLLRDRHNVTDPEAWHLNVLLEVCQAIAFAHHRGVLHRDLKPENVMVGAFGEVLVMDWGLAVGLEDADPRLPKAAEEHQLVGTPAYMAPEMLPHGHGLALSRQTDVFLLGACLFEALTRRPPRESRDRETLFRQILQGGPPIPDEVPSELAHICRRSMAKDPAERFPSVEAFSEAIRDTLAHRSSAHLAAEAEREASALILQLQAGTAEPHTVHSAFGAVQFGYRQALQGWPGNPAARLGLDRVVLEVVEWALERGDVATAEAAMAATNQERTELAQRVVSAREAADAEAARLAAWQRDHDPSVGRVGRLVIILASGLLVSVVPLFHHWIEQATFGGPHIVLAWIAAVAFVGVVFPLVMALRATEGSFTAITRPVTRGLMVVAGTQLVMVAGATLLALPGRPTTILFFPLWIAIASMLGALVDRRLWVGAAGYTIAFLMASAFPESVFYGMAGANAVQTIVGVWALGGWEPRPGGATK